MKCDEARAVRDLYLDSELDSQASLEVEKHLQACPQCAAAFARQHRMDNLVKTSLARGERTPELWNRIERSVARGAAPSGTPPGPTLFSGPLSETLRTGFSRAPRAWAVLAAAWVVIAALHFSGREPETLTMAGSAMPSQVELRLALQQKLQLATELAMNSESGPAPTPKPKPPATGPRSETHSRHSNA